MTSAQTAKLDKIYQTVLLEKYKYKSIFGGKATVIHHFLGNRSLSTRWYVPIGIPLTGSQHDACHSSNLSKKYRQAIINIKGEKWHSDIIFQNNRIAKYIKYQNVVEHINSNLTNYF